MNAMNIPGFTAEASLSKNSTNYHSNGFEISNQSNQNMVVQSWLSDVLGSVRDRIFKATCGTGVILTCLKSGKAGEDYNDCLRRGFADCPQ